MKDDESLNSDGNPSTSEILSAEEFKEPTNLFDDPLQRTKCLIQFIKIRKQRAENEIAKRNALKKQKKNAEAILQNAKDGLKSNEDEVLRCEQRLKELDRQRHELCISYKSVINKESELKRQREAAEEIRRNEEQQKLQIEQQNLAVLAQLLSLDKVFLSQQQLKNSQILNAFNTNTSINNRVPQLLTPSSSVGFSLANTNNGIGTITSVSSAINSSSSALNVQQHLTSAQQLANAVEVNLQQQMQQQNVAAATLNFLRQQYGNSNISNATGQQQIQQQSQVDNFLLKQLQQQHQQFLVDSSTNNEANSTKTLSFLQKQQQQQQQQQQQSALNVAATALQQAITGSGISQELMYQLIANINNGSKTKKL